MFAYLLAIKVIVFIKPELSWVELIVVSSQTTISEFHRVVYQQNEVDEAKPIVIYVKFLWCCLPKIIIIIIIANVSQRYSKNRSDTFFETHVVIVVAVVVICCNLQPRRFTYWRVKLISLTCLSRCRHSRSLMNADLSRNSRDSNWRYWPTDH